MSMLVALLLTVFFIVDRNASTDSRSFPVQEGVQVLSISRIQKSGGVVTNQSMSSDEIDHSLSVALLDCLAGYSMTTHPVSVPKTMFMEDPYVYISIWLQNADRSTFRVNVSTVDVYSNVEYSGEYFGVLDASALLRDLDALLPE